MKTSETLESEVRSYCRSFPVVFSSARGSTLTDDTGKRYLDFFAGAGALNYGHNHPELKDAVRAYLDRDGITHSLDLMSEAKAAFLEAVDRVLLQPRRLDYKVMFPGPTGTNAVEAALKLARKVTGRTDVAAFTNGFHGMTLGALATTGSASKRGGAGVPLPNVVRLPFEGYRGRGSCNGCSECAVSDRCCSLSDFERLLTDASSGVEKPAAVLVETVQGEGGVRPASMAWLRGLRELTRRHDVLLIVDDIQVGCGRTGSFFSFDEAGIQPDIVCLSKSLSGLGLPFSLVLMRRDIDAWAPGEHNGTFRGFNWAMVSARVALEKFWTTDDFSEQINHKAQVAAQAMDGMAQRYGLVHRGRGLIRGLEFPDPGQAGRVSAEAFRRGLLVETAGADDEVLKLLCPLVIETHELTEGLSVLDAAIARVASSSSKRGRVAPTRVAARQNGAAL
jgi:diaminobutyrate-2-oxoglutarate transaminase